MSAFSRTGAAALARASTASTSRAAARRTLVTIPAPELSNAAGTTELAVRTFERMPNMTYAFAIVRAIEAKYGVVLNLDVVKDADTLRPANRLFVTLLKPAELDADERFEIPAPKFNPAESTGGVTLAEIEASLRPAQALEAIEGDAPARTIKFTLEPRTRKAKDMRYLRYNNKTSPREAREDDEIVRSLQAFSGGFFGGLSGVADKFKELVIEVPVDPKEAHAAHEAEETLRAEIAAQEAVIARDLAAQKAARAAAANAAAEKAVAAEQEREGKAEAEKAQAEAEDAALDEKAARLEMLKNRALDAARRKVAADAEARQAAAVSKAAAAKAKAQAARAEPTLAAQEVPVKPAASKSTWRWFEKS